MAMRIALSADHAGFELKDQLAAWLAEAGHEIIDLGTNSSASVDYPDFGALLGEAFTPRADADGSVRFVVASDEDMARAIRAVTLAGVPIYEARISAELETASSSLITASLLTYRDSSIGLDTNGPSANYYELRYLVYELIKNLSQEIAYSAQSLQLAVEDMQITDTEAEDALEAHARKIREEKVGMPGSWNDPWN